MNLSACWVHLFLILFNSLVFRYKYHRSYPLYLDFYVLILSGIELGRQVFSLNIGPLHIFQAMASSALCHQSFICLPSSRYLLNHFFFLIPFPFHLLLSFKKKSFLINLLVFQEGKQINAHNCHFQLEVLTVNLMLYHHRMSIHQFQEHKLVTSVLNMSIYLISGMVVLVNLLFLLLIHL